MFWQESGVHEGNPLNHWGTCKLYADVALGLHQLFSGDKTGRQLTSALSECVYSGA